jgi:hypothetical protein
MPDGGNAISIASLNLQMRGVNGESSIVIYEWGSCP